MVILHIMTVPLSNVEARGRMAEVVHAGSDAEFDVELATSGRVIRVGRGQTVAQALQAVGVALPLSCGQGASLTIAIPTSRRKSGRSIAISFPVAHGRELQDSYWTCDHPR